MVAIPYFRCVCCNRELNPFESTRKGSYSGEYIGLCNRCFSSVEDEMDVEINPDLHSETDNIPDEEPGDNGPDILH